MKIIQSLLPKNSLLALLCSASLVFINACSTQDGLIGSWDAVEGKNNFAVKQISFKQDGSFYFDTVQGNWSINEKGQLVITFPDVLPSRYTYTINDTTLILNDQIGVAGEFRRAR
ncbi:MAG: hypothetical protein AAF571_12555 [Verrucomicrobiota bacterium]